MRHTYVLKNVCISLKIENNLPGRFTLCVRVRELYPGTKISSIFQVRVHLVSQTVTGYIMESTSLAHPAPPTTDA